MSIKFDGLMLLTLVGIAGGVYVYSQREKIANAVNPASRDNLAYSGVNAIGAELSGQRDFSLGAWIYDVTHPNERF